jgi:DNA segregation ATPase FtsK/SpoIIIE, S-DNA-T family
MAQSRKSVQPTEQPPLWRSLDFSLQNRRLQQVGALVVTLCGALLVAAVLGLLHSGATDALALGLRLLFGFGAIVVAVMVMAGGAWALRALVNDRFVIAWRRVVGGEVLFIALLSLVHIPYPDGHAAADSGIGGGMIGWAISQLLLDKVGKLPAVGLLLLVAGLGAVWAFQLDFSGTGDWINRQFENFQHRTPAEEPIEAVQPSRTRPARKKTVSRDKPAESEFTPTAASPAKRLRRDKRLPSLDMFRERSKIDIDTALMDERAQIIEETLESFGIPVKVVEKQQGPTVTQFGLRPGEIERKLPDGSVKRMKVKVSRITALANDLALALSASPIRIEAPVPGKSVVGIEVPNEKSSMVSLRSVFKSDDFRKLEKPLKIALGQDVAGTPVFADLAAMPHVLIAGATGSGKSVCLNAVIASLLCNNAPEDLVLIMLDPKMVELVMYNGIPHLSLPVVTDLAEAARTLHRVMLEMDRRFQLFKEAGVRNLDAYNKKPGIEKTERFIVVVIDELADLMMTAPEDIEKTICRLAQMARATGIHLVLATQRPSVDVVTGLIKANFPARISFAVTSQTDSRVILDSGGAEKLLGRGDMLYMASDAPKLQRLQGCYVPDEELRAVVKYWRDNGFEDESVEGPFELPAASSVAAAGKDRGDELLDEAITLVRQFDRASTSFLQRRMGIGYNRAAKLIDMMEDRRIIGKVKEGGLAREVLIKGDDADAEMEIEEE